ncbi:MAG: Holliday junction resolvase RecU [Bacilli bacterium]|jgi:recombination protein U|nr:Holliday junction resolvase RecU [Bacilli bacterium]
MIRYPGGSSPKPKNEKVVNKPRVLSSANRGMNLEEDINISNQYYIDKDIAVITKRPTPINVVKVDYSRGAIITNAYFEKQSTTDYNGVYRGKYLDFEAKSTKLRTSFPLSNITLHQIQHLKRVLKHGGIAFFVIRFEAFGETFLLDASFVIEAFKGEKRKSIPYHDVKRNGHLIKESYIPRLFYLEVIDSVYF